MQTLTDLEQSIRWRLNHVPRNFCSDAPAQVGGPKFQGVHKVQVIIQMKYSKTDLETVNSLWQGLWPNQSIFRKALLTNIVVLHQLVYVDRSFILLYITTSSSPTLQWIGRYLEFYNLPQPTLPHYLAFHLTLLIHCAHPCMSSLFISRSTVHQFLANSSFDSILCTYP